MRVYKQPTSRFYWGEFRFKGQSHRKSLKTTSEREAESRLRQWYESVVAGGSPWGGEQTVSLGQAIEKYEGEAMPGLEPGTVRTYASSLIKIIDHFGEEIQLHEITREKLFEYEQARRKHKVPRTDRPVSTARIRRDFNALSQVFNHAIAAGLTEGNPVIAYLKIRSGKKRGGLKDSMPRTRYLSLEEEQRLIAETAGHQMLRAFVILSIDTGLRWDEMLEARWTWVRGNEITVPAEIAKSDRERTVPLLPRSKDVLASLERRGPYILWHDDGKQYTTIRTALRTAIRKAGIEKFTPHDLRRTCGCRLLQDHKMRLEAVSKWLGHSNVQVTARHYAFLTADALHDALRDSPVLKAREG